MNKYITDYETIRPFLRFISYGCYHKSYFIDIFGKSARLYEDNLSRIRLLLPDELRESLQNRRLNCTLRGDTYYCNDNYLIATYLLKAVKPGTLFMVTAVLQILWRASEPLAVNEILTKLDEENYIEREISADKGDFVGISSLQRYLQKMTQWGIITCQRRKNYFLYTVPHHLPINLTPSEVKNLLAAIDFYKNIAPLSVPGYFLSATVREMYGVSAPPNKGQFPAAVVSAMSDEDVIYVILHCMENNREFCFTYGGRREVVNPRSISVDYIGGLRRQLKGQTILKRRRKPVMHEKQYKLEKIAKPSVGSVAAAANGTGTAPAKTAIHLRFSYDGAIQAMAARDKLSEFYPDAQISAAKNGTFRAVLFVGDTWSVIPVLRRFFPHVEVSAQHNPQLRVRILTGIEEALAGYGDTVNHR